MRGANRLDTLVVQPNDTRSWQNIVGSAVNALSIPLWEYDRKVKTKGIDGARTQAVEYGLPEQREEPTRASDIYEEYKRLYSFLRESVYRWCMAVVSSYREMLG